jgi:hypothetical protein
MEIAFSSFLNLPLSTSECASHLHLHLPLMVERFDLVIVRVRPWLELASDFVDRAAGEQLQLQLQLPRNSTARMD